MDPVTNKILQGIPYAGMGSTLERNSLIGVIRNLIEQDKYTVDYILNYAESVGYQRQMAEDVFKELTGLSPKLIVNNNEYYNMPAYVPNMCIAWGISKSNKEKAFYVVPFEYGYAVMEKDEVNAPVATVVSATIPEAIDELKKVAKGIQTLDKIITKKLLETENIQTVAETPHQVNKPYCVSPLQALKKNFKDKVINVSEFERKASKLLEADEITVEEAEDLMTWKQDVIDEDESYANDTLQLDENWKPLGAEDIDENDPDYENRVQEAYNQLAGMIQVEDAFSDYASRCGLKLFDAYIRLGREIADEWDVKPEAVFGEMAITSPELTKKLEQTDQENFNKEMKTWKDASKKSVKSEKIMPSEIYDIAVSKLPSEDIDHHNSDLYIKVTPESKKLVETLEYKDSGMLTTFKDDEGATWYELPFCYPMGKQASKKVKSSKIIQVNVYDIDWNFDELDEEDKPTEKLPDFYDNLNIEIDKNSEDFKMTRDDIENMIDDSISEELFNEFGYYPESYNWTYSNKKQASKKVTAENMDLDDIEAEDNKDQVQEEIEKINEKPAEEIFSETTPEQYFEDALAEDKVDTINEVVSRCIDKFSEKFKDFDKYNVEILSYNTKVLGDYKPTEEEMVEDKELNANAILQVILAIRNNADESEMKKALAVFSVTNGELHWTGTIRGENDQVVAFTEEGLDSFFEVEDIKEDELEDII